MKTNTMGYPNNDNDKENRVY